MHQNLHIIVAMTDDRLIGHNNSIPWDLPEDMQLFRQLTLGNTVIMGKKTFNSIGQPLAGRHNIIISSTAATRDIIHLCRSFDEGLKLADSFGHDIFCIGGRGIYQAALPLAATLHISWVAGKFCGDTFFPDFDMTAWQEFSRRDYDGFCYVCYQRKNKGSSNS